MQNLILNQAVPADIENTWHKQFFDNLLLEKWILSYP